MASKHRGAHSAGKPPSQRQLRVGEEIRHTLAEILRRGDFHDPELAELNVTVTEVRISPDLRNATVFVTPLGGGGMDEALTALKRGAPYLRGQIARALTLRYAPMLSFEGDTSFDYAHHIDNILHSPEVARDLAPHKLGRVNGDDDEGDDDEDDEDDSWDEEEDASAEEDESDDLDEEDDDGSDDEPAGGRRGS